MLVKLTSFISVLNFDFLEKIVTWKEGERKASLFEWPLEPNKNLLGKRVLQVQKNCACNFRTKKLLIKCW
jgi:hypothetical protein